MKDVIIVGSGASAVNAAAPLVEAGLDVLMLDVGRRDAVYTNDIPNKDFESIRREDENQHRYFLGRNFEGIPFGAVRVGAQLTPPRQYLAGGESPVMADGFEVMESHALGGLAAGWGAGTPPYTDDDIVDWPLSRRDLQPHYDAVTNRVGLCGAEHDDLERFHGPSPGLLPAPRPDSNAETIFKRYRRAKAKLNARGVFAGAPRLALATREFRGRGPVAYNDMEFWADQDRAVYRPVYTVEELKQRSNFEYRRHALATAFEEKESSVIVHARDLEAGTSFSAGARRLVLSAGAFGTSRIVLESLRLYNRRLPLLSNSYVYYPCVVWARLGKATRDRRYSLTQAMIYYQPSGNTPMIMGQAYSYRSLMTFKLVKESPLARRESITLMRELQPYFVIFGVHHSDRKSSQKAVWLQPCGGNEPALHVEFQLSEEERKRQRTAEKGLLGNLPTLGCLPLKRIDPGLGSSIHYAGTLPMSSEEKPLTTRLDGTLRGTRFVYIADGSLFPSLPAKGLTFTCMALADRVGEEVKRTL